MKRLAILFGAVVITLAAMGSQAQSGDRPASVTPPDRTKPTISITNGPKASARLTNAITSLFSGKAADNVLVTQVVYQVNGGPFQPATGTTSWTASVTNTPGTNLLVFQSIDASGNVSLPLQRLYFDVVTNGLTLLTNGPGTNWILSNFKGTNLEVGRSYTVSAVSLGGNVFSNWTGSITSSGNPLTFVMQSNMVIQANFIANPFTSIAGQCDGLFFDTNTASVASAGLLRGFTIDHYGHYQSLVQARGRNYAIAGAFDFLGHSSNFVARAASLGGNLIFDLNLSWINNPPQVYGSVIAMTNLPGSTNLVYQTNLLTTPFASLAGEYNAIFFDNLGVSVPSAGMLTAFTIDRYGHYTSRFDNQGVRRTISGDFNFLGHSSNFVARAATSGGNFSFDLNLDRTSSPARVLGTLLVQPGVLLQAVFATNQFYWGAGEYNGLFFDTNGVSVESAGMLSGFTLDAYGHYSGRLISQGIPRTITGSFDYYGHSSNFVARAASLGGDLVLDLNLNWTNRPRQITGRVSNAAWTAQLGAEQAAFLFWPSAAYTMLVPLNAAPQWAFAVPNDLAGDQANQNTALIPQIVTTNGPIMQTSIFCGYSYLLLTNMNGTVTLSGAMADGTPINQTVPVSSAGNVPLYASLYANKGLILGWITLSSNAVTGTVACLKPASAELFPSRPGLFPAGFDSVVDVLGSPWNAPARGVAPLPLANGKLDISILDGPGIPYSPTTNTFTVAVTTNNTIVKVGNLPTNALSGVITPKTGKFTVTFNDGKKMVTGTGALLQNSTNAGAAFKGTYVTGALWLH